jgi:hypothetical protein
MKIWQQPERGQPCRHDVTGSPAFYFTNGKFFFFDFFPLSVLTSLYTIFHSKRECNHSLKKNFFIKKETKFLLISSPLLFFLFTLPTIKKVDSFNAN